MISSFSRIFGMATPYSYVRGLAKLEPKTRIDLLKANASSTVMAGKIDSNPVQAVAKVQFHQLGFRIRANSKGCSGKLV